MSLAAVKTEFKETNGSVNFLKKKVLGKVLFCCEFNTNLNTQNRNISAKLVVDNDVKRCLLF